MRRRILAAATALTVLVAPAAAQAAKQHYRAEVRRTTGGWAHVKANSYGSLGFGYGYAYAQDQICELADIVTTVNAERSRWFGPTTGTSNRTSSTSASRTSGRCSGSFAGARRTARRRSCARRSRASPPATTRTCARPAARSCRIRPAAARAGCARSRRSTCTGASTSSGLRASSGNFLREIVGAEPPAAGAAADGAVLDPQAFAERLDPTGLGSNAYGIGRTARAASARSCSATRTSRGRAPSAGTRCT